VDHATVIETAARLIDEEGLDQLSLSRLAGRLGIRTPSLYNHVTGLPGLKNDLACACLRDLTHRFTHATVGKSHTEAIFAFANAYRAYARDYPGRYALTLQAPAPDNQELRVIAVQAIDVARAILAPYQLSEEDTTHTIRGLRSIIHGFTSLEASNAFGLAVDLDASFHRLVSQFIAGLNQLSTANKTTQ
jgi:AcrR family transcriptional regulator